MTEASPAYSHAEIRSIIESRDQRCTGIVRVEGMVGEFGPDPSFEKVREHFCSQGIQMACEWLLYGKVIAIEFRNKEDAWRFFRQDIVSGMDYIRLAEGTNFHTIGFEKRLDVSVSEEDYEKLNKNIVTQVFGAENEELVGTEVSGRSI